MTKLQEQLETIRKYHNLVETVLNSIGDMIETDEHATHSNVKKIWDTIEWIETKISTVIVDLHEWIGDCDCELTVYELVNRLEADIDEYDPSADIAVLDTLSRLAKDMSMGIDPCLIVQADVLIEALL